MKVIKRDGRTVDFDRSKIQVSLERAGEEVEFDERTNKEDVKGIIRYIEGLDKNRMLAEDIQDIVCQKLMEINKNELAQRYILYKS